jgi:hypothetical protein
LVLTFWRLASSQSLRTGGVFLLLTPSNRRRYTVSTSTRRQTLPVILNFTSQAPTMAVTASSINSAIRMVPHPDTGYFLRFFSCRWIVQFCTIQRQLKRNRRSTVLDIRVGQDIVLARRVVELAARTEPARARPHVEGTGLSILCKQQHCVNKHVTKSTFVNLNKSKRSQKSS